MSNIISLFSNNTQITFQRQEDGYINATSLCKSVGREFHTWNRSKTTIAFIKELSYDTQICGTDLIQIQQGGEPHLQGTWDSRESFYTDKLSEAVNILRNIISKEIMDDMGLKILK